LGARENIIDAPPEIKSPKPSITGFKYEEDAGGDELLLLLVVFRGTSSSRMRGRYPWGLG
jgi:hypothetical protein